jgi:PAS domain S-box-containing protein
LGTKRRSSRAGGKRHPQTSGVEGHPKAGTSQVSPLAPLRASDVLPSLLRTTTSATDAPPDGIALAESERRYRQLVENLNEGIWVLDASANTIFLNRRMAEMLGRPAKAVYGRPIFDFMNGDGLQACQEKLHQLRRGVAQQHECEFVRKDGQRFWALVGTRPLVDAHGHFDGVLAAVADITDRKHSEQALRQLASELTLAEERERRRMANDLHDAVGQSVAITLARLEQVRQAHSPERTEKALDEVRHMLEQIAGQVSAMVFDLSPPTLYMIGLEAAVRGLAQDLSERHRVRVTVAEDGREKPLTDDSRVFLFRAVRELLINVVKHAQAQRATVSIRREGDHIRIDVNDNGIGIDMKTAPGNDQGVGGFGLFSVRERLTYLGGRLAIRDTSGKGTRVTLWAPLAAPAKTPASRRGRSPLP